MVANTKPCLRLGALAAVHVCAALALGNASGGCGFGDTPPSRANFAGAGDTAGAPGAGTSGGAGGMIAAQGGGPDSTSGSAGTPNSTSAGSSAGGTQGLAGSSGSSATAGSGGSSGSAAGGMSAGGAGHGGSGGSAGSSGNAGTGGAGTVHCADHPLPSKQNWMLTASSSDAGSPPVNATDGDLATRWSTGVSQANDWLQVDFGAETAIDSVKLMLGSNAGDYPRSYEVRVSNTSQNSAVAPLVTGAGQQATDTVIAFTSPAVGRYLFISQIGSINGTWWSVAELNIACTH